MGGGDVSFFRAYVSAKMLRLLSRSPTEIYYNAAGNTRPYTRTGPRSGRFRVKHILRTVFITEFTGKNSPRDWEIEIRDSLGTGV